MKIFRFKNRELKLDGKTLIMGILNVTPDSFSDGAQFKTPAEAVDFALKMIESGADIIDIGGESTRPGAELIPEKIEAERIVPVIEALKAKAPEAIISADTRKSKVARLALEAGADIINDVSGLRYSEGGTAEAAAEAGAGLVIMHMRGTPETMQNKENLVYSDLTGEIKSFLLKQAKVAENKGLGKESIIIDPGIGFSKTAEQNMEIISNINFFTDTEYPVLVGPSRKSFIGKILNKELPSERIWGTAGVAGWLAFNNTDFIRVHDVDEIRQVLTLAEKCRNGLKKSA